LKLKILLGPCRFVHPAGGEVTNAECKVIHDLIGDDNIPHNCLSLLYPEDPFVGKDATHHRNSWLWPKFARRATKKKDGSFHETHVSSNTGSALVNNAECTVLFAALKAKLGETEAKKALPKACI